MTHKYSPLFDRIDIFGAKTNNFNFEGRRKVHTNCGVICSMILAVITTAYFIFKFTYITTGQDLSISSYQKFGQFETIDESIDLVKNNF